MSRMLGLSHLSGVPVAPGLEGDQAALLYKG